MYGVDYAYAATRLEGTIVRLSDGTPIQIRHVNGGTGSVLYYLLTNFNKTLETHLDNIDTCPVPLGYYNDKTGALYISRIPCRRYRQGLRLEQCAIEGHNGSLANIVDYDVLNQTIEGTYPSRTKVVQDLFNIGASRNPFDNNEKKFRTTAFHRFWAIDPSANVMYRGKKVGKVSKDSSIVLGERFRYLKEALSEVT